GAALKGRGHRGLAATGERLCASDIGRLEPKVCRGRPDREGSAARLRLDLRERQVDRNVLGRGARIGLTDLDPRESVRGSAERVDGDKVAGGESIDPARTDGVQRDRLVVDDIEVLPPVR